jgi:hypothetical protein
MPLTSARAMPTAEAGYHATPGRDSPPVGSVPIPANLMNRDSAPTSRVW